MKNKVVIIYSTIELVNGNSAGSARVMNYARALADAEITVILLSFSRPINISTHNLKEVENGIFTSGNKVTMGKYQKTFLYPFYLCNFVMSINAVAKSLSSCSLLHYTSTDVLLDYFTVWFLIKQKKQRVFYEANEIRKYAASFELPPRGLLQKIRKSTLISRLNKSEKLTRYYTGLICISTNIEEYFTKYNTNTIRIPILSDKVDGIDLTGKSFKKGETFRIGFFGSVSYKKENLELLLNSIYKIIEEKVAIKLELDFYGSIDKLTRQLLNETLNKLGLEKHVFYKEKLKQAQVLPMMKEYHLLVLPRGKSLQNHYGFSTKLSEYLISGVPCLITHVSDNGLYIKDDFNGFIVEPDDIDAFAKKLSSVIENYNTYTISVPKEAVKTVRNNFTYTNYSKILAEILC